MNEMKKPKQKLCHYCSKTLTEDEEYWCSEHKKEIEDNHELDDLKRSIGALIREVIMKTNEGEIDDMIGYGSQKYGEEMNINIGKWNVFYCDYYDRLQIDDDDVELKDVPKLLKIEKYLEERLLQHTKDVIRIKQDLAFTKKDKEVLRRALNLLVDKEGDVVDYSKLYKKLEVY